MEHQFELSGLSKTKFAATIQKGQSFDDVFLLDEITQREKKNGGFYWSLTLRDKTGVIDAKVWDADKMSGPIVQGQFVKVRAESSEYNGKVQLTLSKVRALDEATEGINVDDFVPVGPKDRFAQIEILKLDIQVLIEDPGLRAVALQLVLEPMLHQGLRDAPAAKTMHHAYVGGLLEHSTSMMGLVRKLCSHYADSQNEWTLAGWEQRKNARPLDEDLLLTACLFHDVGKIRELTWRDCLRYSVEGQLVGHVVIGLEMLDRLKPLYFEHAPLNDSIEKVEVFNRRWDHLRHLIASHHGTLEWGAAKTPMTREAMLFHLIDMIDSRMGAMDLLQEKEVVDRDGFTGWQRLTSGPIWRAK